jgi:SPOR domain
MHTDQDREFELVLGNKQLFSLLFLVFVLLGVFFAMGYAMGRTSAPADIARQNSTARPEVAAPPAGRPSATEGSAMPPTIPAPDSAARSAEPAPVQPAPATTAGFIDPKPGEVFLQVSAVARPEAELLVEVLSRKGFRASMAPGPSEKVIRVLVGPAATESDLTKLRTDLEQSGFKAMVRRY